MEQSKRMFKGSKRTGRLSKTTQTELFDFAQNERMILRLRQELAAAHATIQKLAYPCRKGFDTTGQAEADLGEFSQFRVTSVKNPSSTDDFIVSLNNLALQEINESQENERPSRPHPVKPPQVRAPRPKTQSSNRVRRDAGKQIELLPLPPIALAPAKDKKRTVKREFKKRQGRKKSEVLDEILFNEQDRRTWDKLYVNLKRNPDMLSAYLNAKNSPQKSAKPKKEWDWADSSLNITEHPVEVMSSATIDLYLKEISEDDPSPERKAQLFNEALSAFETLRGQLGLADSWMPIPSSSVHGVKTLLKACSRLVRCRALTLKILRLIHEREDELLKLMTMPQEDREIKSQFQTIVKLSEHIEQTVVFWKHSGLPYSSFVYLGEDITEKIKQDLSRVCSIYSSLSLPDLYSNAALLEPLN